MFEGYIKAHIQLIKGHMREDTHRVYVKESTHLHKGYIKEGTHSIKGYVQEDTYIECISKKAHIQLKGICKKIRI